MSQPPASSRCRQTGQALVEFAIIAPILLFFCFGILQYALLFQAKATLDSATLEAAREGAVHHAELAPMQRGLARGLTALYAHGTSDDAVRRARQAAVDVVNTQARIVLLNPTRAQLDDFAQWRNDPKSNQLIREIPNDLLRYRRADIAPRSGTNIQDANLLKIRVHYCFDMIVPFVNRAVYYAVNGIGALSDNGITPTEPADADGDPYGSPVSPDGLCRRKLADGRLDGHWPIALESVAIVRMQSAYRGAQAQADPNPRR